MVFLQDVTDLCASDVITPIQFGPRSKAPIYLVHPASGLSYIYSAIGPLQRTVFGISNPSPTPAVARQRFARLEDYVECYAKAIVDSKPDGELIIGGFSFGASVALRLAEVLQEERFGCQRISAIFLLDGRNPSNEIVRDWALARWSAREKSQGRSLHLDVRKGAMDDEKFEVWHNEHAEKVMALHEHASIRISRSIPVYLFKATMFPDGFPQREDDELSSRNYWTHEQIPDLTIFDVKAVGHEDFLKEEMQTESCTELVKEVLKSL